MVFELLRNMMAESLGCDESEITGGSELRYELGLSDAELEQIMDAMSGELGFRYRASDLEDVNTVADLVRYIADLV